MKKLIAIAMCLLSITLCACEKPATEQKTAESKTSEESETGQGATQKETETKTSEKSEATHETVAQTHAHVEIKTDPKDPYSYVIADIIAGWADRSPDHTWRDSYILYDIEGTKNKALLIGWENSHGFVQEIYTIKDGVAELKLSILDDSSNRLIRILKNGYIRTENLEEMRARGYYRFDEGGQLRLIVGLGSYWDGGGRFRIDPTGTTKDFFFEFVPDGTEVSITDEENQRYLEEFAGIWEPAELDWTPLKEYGQ